MRIIEAVILAAGMGTRLKPLTNERPKCLVYLHNKNIITRQLELLRRIKVRKVIIAVGYKKELIQDFVIRAFPDLEVCYVYNPNFATRNTLDSLSLVAQNSNLNGEIFLLNGDVVFDEEILHKLLASDPNESCIAVEYGKCGKEEVKVVLDEAGNINALNKLVFPLKAVGESVGIHKLSQEFWKDFSSYLKRLAPQAPSEYFEYGIERMIRDKKAARDNLKLIPIDISPHRALEIDSSEDLERAKRIFAKR